MAACKYGDPSCPCQDGGACHYEPQGKTLAMLVRPEFVLRAIGQANAEGYTAGQRDMRKTDIQWLNANSWPLAAIKLHAQPITEPAEAKEKDNG